jgi:hypothetical protein
MWSGGIPIEGSLPMSFPTRLKVILDTDTDTDTDTDSDVDDLLALAVLLGSPEWDLTAAAEPVDETLDATALLRTGTTIAAIGPLTNVADAAPLLGRNGGQELVDDAVALGAPAMPPIEWRCAGEGAAGAHRGTPTHG